MIEAFGVELVSRITGLTDRQLARLDEVGVVSPSVAPREPFWPPLYSFLDVKKLRLCARMMRLDMDAPAMRRLIDDAEAAGIDDPLTTIQFVGDVDEAGRPRGRAFVVHPKTGKIHSARHFDQSAEVYNLKMMDLEADLVGTIDDLTRRTESGSVEKRRGVQANQWVVVGTRIPTRLVAQLAREGWGPNRIRESYPILTHDDIRAALEHEGVPPDEVAA